MLIINNKEFAKRYLNLPLSIEDFVALAKVIATLELANTRIDLATLGKEWLEEKATATSIEDFVSRIPF